MKKQIDTHYIYLDTSIFIKENFFAGNKLKAFLKHSENSDIELLITDITLNESIANLVKSARESYSALKRALKEIDTKSKLFKNIDSLNYLFQLHDTFAFEKELATLLDLFRQQIKNYFDIIDLDSEVSLKVIADYFNQNPPFKDGKKKSEFPDAFVLNSLDAWCKKRGEKVYVVSDDDDIISYKSDYLIPIKHYDKLLDQISYTYSDDNIHPKVEDLITKSEEDIIQAIKEEFLKEFPFDGFDQHQGFEYQINSLYEINAHIKTYSVLYFNYTTASVELIVPIDYNMDVSYEDKSMGWYDKEDDMWYNTESYRETLSSETILKVLIKVTIELPGKPLYDYEDRWEFVEISSGVPTDIAID